MGTIRQELGCLLYDWPRLLRYLGVSRWWNQSNAWIHFRNRADRLVKDAEGRGVACAWEYTQDLHLCQLHPVTGYWLLKQAQREWPFRLRATPEHVSQEFVCANGDLTARNSSALPDVSFLLSHRGEERMPLLQTTLQSIAGQTGITFECIVVEQDHPSRLRERLPSWVRFIHTTPEDGMPFCRSWAFNVAARAARGSVLICHDHDIVIPANYGAEQAARIADGFDVVDLKRFLFHLSEKSTAEFCRMSPVMPRRFDVVSVMENMEGGASFAITRDAYFSIGGFDEAFRGWGGEDNDFWDRCRTLRLNPYGYLPLIHLWHRPQPGKQVPGNPRLALLAQRRTLPMADRIAQLKQQDFGQRERPVKWNPSC